MTFVNELIPETEKEKFTFSVATNTDGTKPTLWKWAIDKERNAYLVLAGSEGGAYEGTQLTRLFVLSWNDQEIHFSADSLPIAFSEDGAEILWKVKKIEIPSKLKNKKDEIYRLISDALNSFGESFNREIFSSVNIKFELNSGENK